MKSDLANEASFNAEVGYGAPGNLTATNMDSSDNHVEARKIAASDYSDSIDIALETKQYHHWESDEERDKNRASVENYDEKKRTVDKASLQTQSSVLKEHETRFTYENLTRVESELGSNKIEIYNERSFAADKDPTFGTYRILGLRDFPDGKICVRDSENLDTLRHVSTHETMHDLSYQATNHEVETLYDERGRAVTTSDTVHSSGLHRFEKREVIVDGETLEPEVKQYNRYLNEGYTELYTIEEMQKRGESPSFDSYTEEVGWAMLLREKVGSDIIADAYFGGHLDELAHCVDSMSDFPKAWEQLNRHIDAYHYTKDQKHREAVCSILDSMQGSTIKEKRLVKR